MKMNIVIVLAVSSLLLLSSLHTQAQSRKPSYYVTLQGDTVQAEILRASDKKNSHRFYYKSIRQRGARQELVPKDVKVVVYGNERFVSASLPTEVSGEKVFLKQLIESEVSFYKSQMRPASPISCFRKRRANCSPCSSERIAASSKSRLPIALPSTSTTPTS